MERLLLFLLLPAALWLAPVKLEADALKQVARLLWLTGGFFMVWRGASMLLEAVPVMGTPAAYLYETPWLLAVAIVLAIGIGLLKGAVILKKSCQRNLARLAGLKQAQKLVMVYDIKSWVLIGVMVSLAQVLSFFGVDPVWRGLLLVGIGTGLVVSSQFYSKPLPLLNNASPAA